MKICYINRKLSGSGGGGGRGWGTASPHCGSSSSSDVKSIGCPHKFLHTCIAEQNVIGTARTACLCLTMTLQYVQIYLFSTGERTQEGNEEKKSVQSKASQGPWLRLHRSAD